MNIFLKLIGLKFLVALSLPLLITSCASTASEDLEKITVGMDKAVVLDIVGDPASTDRNNSVDEWVYTHYVNEQKKQTKIYFKNGKVVSSSDYNPYESNKEESFQQYKDKVIEKREKTNQLFKNIGE